MAGLHSGVITYIVSHVACCQPNNYDRSDGNMEFDTDILKNFGEEEGII